MNTANVRIATRHMFERYLHIIPNDGELCSELTFGQLKALCQAGLDNYNTFPIDKLNRWIGFIQAALVTSNITTIQDEREFSRRWFHDAYRMDGIEIPPTINVKQ